MSDLYIKTTPAFDRQAKKSMSKEALEELLDYLIAHPESGDVIRGSGGVRKLRWRSGKNDKGKSGGVRIIYHYSHSSLIILITMYGKSEKENISDAERNEIKLLLPALIDKYRGK